METNLNNFHGIIFNISLKHKLILKELEVIGKRKVFFGLLTIYKINVSPEKVKITIDIIQENMAERILFIKQKFYVHFYRNNELIVVFKNKIFNITTDKSTWFDVIEHGKSLGIKERQLDFQPCKFEDEMF